MTLQVLLIAFIAFTAWGFSTICVSIILISGSRQSKPSYLYGLLGLLGPLGILIAIAMIHFPRMRDILEYRSMKRKHPEWL